MARPADPASELEPLLAALRAARAVAVAVFRPGLATPAGTGLGGSGARGPMARPIALALVALGSLVVLVGLGGRIAEIPSAAVAPAPTPISLEAGAEGSWPPPPTTSFAVDPLDLGAKLALVGLLLYLALRLLRRFVAPAALRDGPIVVLASRPLGPKAALHLVAIGERRLLVGESPAGLVGLTELAAEELDLAGADGSWQEVAR